MIRPDSLGVTRGGAAVGGQANGCPYGYRPLSAAESQAAQALGQSADSSCIHDSSPSPTSCGPGQTLWYIDAGGNPRADDGGTGTFGSGASSSGGAVGLLIRRTGVRHRWRLGHAHSIQLPSLVRGQRRHASVGARSLGGARYSAKLSARKRLHRKWLRSGFGRFGWNVRSRGASVASIAHQRAAPDRRRGRHPGTGSEPSSPPRGSPCCDLTAWAPAAPIHRRLVCQARTEARAWARTRRRRW